MDRRMLKIIGVAACLVSTLAAPGSSSAATWPPFSSSDTYQACDQYVPIGRNNVDKEIPRLPTDSSCSLSVLADKSVGRMTTDISVTSPLAGTLPGSAGAFSAARFRMQYTVQQSVSRLTFTIHAHIASASISDNGLAFSHAGPVDEYVGIADAYFAPEAWGTCNCYTEHGLPEIVATYDGLPRMIHDKDMLFSLVVHPNPDASITPELITLEIALSGSAMLGNPALGIQDAGMIRTTVDATITSVTVE